MEAKPQKTFEELEREWWEKWRAADYSWKGLATKSWDGWSVTASGDLVESANAPEGSRRANLQDYWRDQADFLIEGDGRQWTRVHLPPFWSDGSPTGKLDWGVSERAELQAIVRGKLQAAAPSDFTGEASVYQRPVGADRRAQLHGAILFNGGELRRPDRPATYVTMSRAAFLDDANLTFLEVTGPADFSEDLFCGGVDFCETFRGPADLSEIVVKGTFFAMSESFCGPTAVSTAFIGGSSYLATTSVGDAFNCDNTVFSGDCDFSSVTFPGLASFIWAVFRAHVSFSSAKFADRANFNNAKFEEWAAFNNAKFSAPAFFNEVDSTIQMDFDRAYFESGLELRRCKLHAMSFVEATMLGMFRFSATEAFGKCYFNKMKFAVDGREGGLFFEGASFHKLVDFDGAVFPARPENISAAFTGCRFKDWVDFRRTGTHWIAALDESILEDKVLMDDPVEIGAADDFRKFLDGVRLAADEEAQRKVDAEIQKRQDEAEHEHRREIRRAEEEKRKPARPKPPKAVTSAEKEAMRAEAYETRLKELEGGCRAIKVAMGRERNEINEQIYYRFQLMARRRQKCVTFWEKFFAALYAGVSDYGASMIRPFVAMSLMVMGFAVLFWAWSKSVVGGAGIAPLSAWVNGSMRFDPEFFEALRFSASRLLPFGAFGGDTNRWPWLHALVEQQGPVTGFWVRAVASLESVFALVLVFLFALAVRRRFQIS